MDEINKAFSSLPKPSRENFNDVFENYSIKFENQTDAIRMEIALCLIYGLYQSAIMLTNHLLEKFLRDVVVLEESGIETMIPENQKKISGAYKKRNSSGLDNLADEALKLKIITSDQHKEVKEYMKTIRNPYSHGSSNQILKGVKPVKTITASFSNESILKVTDTFVGSFLPLQSLYQEIQAKKDALKYFKFVDSVLLSFYKEKNGHVYKKQF